MLKCYLSLPNASSTRSPALLTMVRLHPASRVFFFFFFFFFFFSFSFLTRLTQSFPSRTDRPTQTVKTTSIIVQIDPTHPFRDTPRIPTPFQSMQIKAKRCELIYLGLLSRSTTCINTTSHTITIWGAPLRQLQIPVLQIHWKLPIPCNVLYCTPVTAKNVSFFLPSSLLFLLADLAFSLLLFFFIFFTLLSFFR